MEFLTTQCCALSRAGCSQLIADACDPFGRRVCFSGLARGWCSFLFFVQIPLVYTVPVPYQWIMNNQNRLKPVVLFCLYEPVRKAEMLSSFFFSFFFFFFFWSVYTQSFRADVATSLGMPATGISVSSFISKVG
jgi:hypothetical protein